jgi:hypothetical protein
MKKGASVEASSSCPAAQEMRPRPTAVSIPTRTGLRRRRGPWRNPGRALERPNGVALPVVRPSIRGAWRLHTPHVVRHGAGPIRAARSAHARPETAPGRHSSRHPWCLSPRIDSLRSLGRETPCPDRFPAESACRHAAVHSPKSVANASFRAAASITDSRLPSEIHVDMKTISRWLQTTMHEADDDQCERRDARIAVLIPHEVAPMLGAHPALRRTRLQLAAELVRWASSAVTQECS